ncbi:MAG: hypothetical protein NZ700_15355 [Gemmataceae bacterium]|nr:hypothetical protein [Gemmataceae bacterium]MDW8264288.1 Trm112 family protein [Gemmataceae bacterium]
MISPDLLAILRCPVDPKRETPLQAQPGYLLCPRCQIKFPIKDGFPVLVVEEAELPPGCDGLAQLEARHTAG